jgi:oligopeptide/dipeptide ABC transporter ATP-binding protein
MTEGGLLNIKGLKTFFHTDRGPVAAVDGLSLHIDEGEIFGVVGESGCGKSVTAQSILRLLDEKRSASYEGEIEFGGHDLLRLGQRAMRAIRGNDISMIFQDPLSSLNPLMTIGEQIAETIRAHRKYGRGQAHQEAVRLLRLTGIPAPERRVNDYPHQLSGGMRQRVMIAIALACEPRLLIADEPTTALDVTIQAQIMDLLVRLNRELGMSILLITHDLGVVAEVCHRVAVMYAGQIVETADVKTLFRSPQHPYTAGLMKSIPRLDRDRAKPLQAVSGMVPPLHAFPAGCRFAPRCAFADERCHSVMPGLERTADTGGCVRCWHAGTLALKEA